MKEGIRRYWKIRRVTENRQFIKRADVRMKVELPLQFMQDTWPLNSRGEIDKESGETMDISNNGLAVYMKLYFYTSTSGFRVRRDARDRSRWCNMLDARDAERRTFPFRDRCSIEIR